MDPTQIPDFQPKPNYLKTIIFSVLVIITLGLIIYLIFQNQKLQKQVLNLPVSPTIKVPSPTPKTISSISLPLDETTEWKSYTNSIHGITFKYPTTWQIDQKGDQDQYNAQINLINDQAKIKMYFNMDGIGGQGQTYQGKSFILDGNNLYLYKKISDYDKTQIVGISTLLYNTLGVFEVNKKTYSITLAYPVGYVKGNALEKDFDQILSTFKFTDNTSICVPSYKVETNSVELTAEQNYSVRCTEQRSEKDCLSVDIYNQKAGDFSVPDQISDCIWKNPTI